MKRRRWVGIAIIPFFFLAPGCLARQIAADGKNFRQAILDMYTDQVMDNLIRAHDGMPFVQLTYRDMLVQDNNEISGTLQDVSLAQNAKTTGPVGQLTSVVRTVSNSWTYGTTAKRDKLLSFHADPVTDKNDIYELYLAFATDPGLFVVSDKKPSCPVHIMRHCHGRYYWVPGDANRMFLALVLRTTFMRGPNTVPPAYYERTISDVESVVVKNQKARPVLLTFDKPLKNASGYLQFDVNKKSYTMHLNAITGKLDVFPNELPHPEGSDVKKLSSTWSPSEMPNEIDTAEKLKGLAVRIFLPDYPPPAPMPIPELQRILDSLDSIRANIPKINNP